MAEKFKKGDIITLKENSSVAYVVTSRNSLLEVKDCYQAGTKHYKMDVEVLAHTEKKYQNEVRKGDTPGKAYSGLDCEDFEIATPEFINQIKMATYKPPKERAEKIFNFKSGLKIKTYPSGRVDSTFNKEREMVVETQANRVKALNKLVEKIKNNEIKKLKSGIYDFNFVSVTEFKDSVGLSKKFEIKTLSDDPEFEVFKDIFDKQVILEDLQLFIDFFKEFRFTPSLRLVNTLALNYKDNDDILRECKNHVAKYFELTGSTDTTSVEDKMNSPEFKQILRNVLLFEPSQMINTRLKIYYGDAGVGKTTKAMKEADNRCIVCNGSLSEDDFLRAFDFDEDGKPTYNPTLFRTCMEKGLPIVLDEFNQLNFNAVRFLQGILDGKSQINYNNEVINIKPGFQVIATMNLVVNGMTISLPAPIIDRASALEKFELSGQDLLIGLM